MKSGCYFYKRSLFSLKHQSSSLNKMIDAFSRLVALLNTMSTQVTRFNVQLLISLPHGIQFSQVSNSLSFTQNPTRRVFFRFPWTNIITFSYIFFLCTPLFVCRYPFYTNNWLVKNIFISVCVTIICEPPAGH